MLNTYKQIAQHLDATVPTLQYIDWDKGQFQNVEEEQYVPCPAVLISININWQGAGNGRQNGTAFIAVKVIVDVANESHTQSTRIDNFVTEMDITQQVHAQLNGFKGIGFNGLQRTTTSAEHNDVGYIAITHNYECNIMHTV